MIGFASRYLFDRLARALTTNLISIFQIEYHRQDLIRGSSFNWPYVWAIVDP